jgi:hypothetical protein
MTMTSFDPAVHGFHFDNRFTNVAGTLPGGLKISTRGRCGGMTYAALDYHHLGRAAPAFVPTAPARVPPDGHPLSEYLLRRQLDSMANQSALRFVTWTLFPDDGLPFARGVRRTGGVDVLIYDPNTHGATTVLRWRAAARVVEASNRPLAPWRGVFVHDHTPRRPPASAG